MAISISNAAAQDAADAIVDLIDVGTGATGVLKIRTGSQPALADDASTGTVLAQLAMNATAFGAAGDGAPGGLVTANAISDDTSADAAGTAAHFEIVDKDDTVVLRGDVREVDDADAGEELVLQSKTISAGQTIGIASLTLTMPEA